MPEFNAAMVRRGLVIIAGLLAFGFCLLMLSKATLRQAYAHSWYPPECCNGSEMGGDCHPVACEELSEGNAGSWKWHQFNFTPAQVHPSQDKFCHVCVGHYNYGGVERDIPHCVFIQAGT